MNRVDFDLEAWRPSETFPEAREVRGETLTGKVILDNARFEDCTFRGATLIYHGGVPPSIRDCTFQGVAFEFAGPAGRTLAFLQALSSRASGFRDLFKASFPKLFGH